jgi:hypothetical protein
MGDRPLTNGGTYTADEIDAKLAAIESGAPATGFTNAAPLTYSTPAIQAQSDGSPIGISADGQSFYQPTIVGAIAVKVDGKEYLIPLCER